MKHTIFFCIIFSVITFPVYSDLTDSDLNKIRLIIKEEVSNAVSASNTLLKEEIAKSERQMKQYVDTKFDAVNTKFDAVDTKFESLDKRISLIVGFVSGLIILVVVTVGIPQIIITWRGKSEKELN